jgi:hypothetical protein
MNITASLDDMNSIAEAITGKVDDVNLVGDGISYIVTAEHGERSVEIYMEGDVLAVSFRGNNEQPGENEFTDAAAAIDFALNWLLKT